MCLKREKTQEEQQNKVFKKLFSTSYLITVYIDEVQQARDDP